MLDSNKIVEMVKDTKHEELNVSITDVLIDNFIQELISVEDKMLLNLTFSENPTQEELDKFLEKWDIEAVGGHKSLMLSYFMKMHQGLKFSEYVQPRLTGLFNFFRFQNLKIIAHFKKLTKSLNDANIPVMILKGGVMKHLRPDLSRVMGDIDILVPGKDYPKVGQIAQTLGYEFYEPNIQQSHSIDLHEKGCEEGTVDVHRYIYMGTGYEQKIIKDLFKRAKKEKVFGVDALIPSYEDIFFLALVNLSKNLRENTSSPGILYALFDCKFLMESKSDFDWNIVIENAKKTKTQVQMCFAIKFINKIVPGILPEKLQKEALFEKELQNYCKVVMFERFYFPKFQEKSRDIKIANSLKSFAGLMEYLNIKPKYYLLKQLRDFPFWGKIFFNFMA